METLGIYVSVPFCRAKCSFCNFASGVFGAGRMNSYCARLETEIAGVRGDVAGMGAVVPRCVDTVFFGGGTPSLLTAENFVGIFARLRGEFDVADDAEITVECAPGQMSDATLEALVGLGMNRVSFGVQSFVDAEAAGVGRLHTGAECEREIERFRAAGVGNLSVDLIAGLPGQTSASLSYSVERVVESGVGHASVYMLEVDEDSRLGREVMAGGTRFHAHAVPEEDVTADLYLQACAELERGGLRQYEISNFARGGCESKHNVKYWKRADYLGFGLDAHSMLRVGDGALRFANGDDLDAYVAGSSAREVTRVDKDGALEEAVFLGLRMVEGVAMVDLRMEFGAEAVRGVENGVELLIADGLMERVGERVRLSARGRLVSNDVFGLLLEGVGV